MKQGLNLTPETATLRRKDRTKHSQHWLGGGYNPKSTGDIMNMECNGKTLKKSHLLRILLPEAHREYLKLTTTNGLLKGSEDIA